MSEAILNQPVAAEQQTTTPVNTEVKNPPYHVSSFKAIDSHLHHDSAYEQPLDLIARSGMAASGWPVAQLYRYEINSLSPSNIRTSRLRKRGRPVCV